jgi:hypothetical protein
LSVLGIFNLLFALARQIQFLVGSCLFFDEVMQHYNPLAYQRAIENPAIPCRLEPEFEQPIALYAACQVSQLIFGIPDSARNQQAPRILLRLDHAKVTVQFIVQYIIRKQVKEHSGKWNGYVWPAEV